VNWTHEKAVCLCKKIETVCVPFGCHVALTGGCLYKEGERKDCDVLFYRIRQIAKIDIEGLVKALADNGINLVSGFGWCLKFVFDGMNIDAFFPEEEGGNYDQGNDNAGILEVI